MEKYHLGHDAIELKCYSLKNKGQISVCTIVFFVKFDILVNETNCSLKDGFAVGIVKGTKD